MKIAMFVPNLRGGGVERVRVLLARELLAKGHDVDLLLRNKGALLDQMPVSARITYLQAAPPRRVSSPWWTTCLSAAGPMVGVH